MGTTVTQKQLNNMRDYFLKTLFYGIPAIPCWFESREEMGSGDGLFRIEANDDYEYDEELENAPEHKSRYHGQGGIGYTYDPNPAWTDPLANPELSIAIANKLHKNPLRTLAVLLHELTHYYCWYTGLDHKDGSRDFEDKLKELGLPNNFDDYIWNKEEGVWEDTFDYESVRKYYDEWKGQYVVRRGRKAS